MIKKHETIRNMLNISDFRIQTEGARKWKK